MEFRLLNKLCTVVLVLGALLGASSAQASLYSYGYSGAVDDDCAVQILGGPASCRVEGSFDLRQADFGATQFGLNADFTLFVNDVAFDTISFPAFALGGIDYCVGYCNEVTTNPAGHVSAIEFTIFPPYAPGQAVFLSHAGWSWDILEPGNGLFGAAAGVVITQFGPSPVPLPSSAFLLAVTLMLLVLMQPVTLRRRLGRSGRTDSNPPKH